MNMNENASFIQFLQQIGWNDSQILNFLLCIDGRISIEDAVKKHNEKMWED